MSRIDEFIADLPGGLKPWAELWTPVLLKLGEVELAGWLELAGSDWLEAYTALVEAMGVDEKIAELQLRRSLLGKLNADNAVLVKTQQRLLYAIVSKALLSLGTA